ncbi:MAG: peptide chain release factor N(5)-glutamine methyltransferase [Clostridiales bacterium]|nr:peptide chain release factor N(5)-glutamine methyltransferase [Clostridiales bacterium]
MKLSEWRAASALPVHEKDLLIEHICGLDKIHIFLNAASFTLSEEMLEALNRFQARRLKGEPLQYILGYAYFMGSRFKVAPGVLIPRPDTEVLVSEVVRQIRSRSHAAKCRVLDLCTGSGCIGISILKKLGNPCAIRMIMSDISDVALALSKENYISLMNASYDTIFIKSDFFASLRGMRFDVIVSNPPYIRTSDLAMLDAEVRDYEPRIALAGGADGLDAYRVIAREAAAFLNEDGHLFLEVGFDQAEEVRALFLQNFTHTEIIKDLNGFGRVVHLYNH